MWDSALNRGQGGWPSSSSDCQVVTCDAGFDATQAPTTQCQKTAKGFFSRANSKSRTACTGKPASDHAEWVIDTTIADLRSGTRGAQNNGECAWACTLGYEKNSARSDCVTISTPPPVVNNSCTTPGNTDPRPPAIDHGTQTRTCGNNNQWGAWVITCDAGFVKDRSGNGVRCRVPNTGYYANAAGVEMGCKSIRNYFKRWKANPLGGLSDDTCDFDCHQGYVKDRGAKSCSSPLLNHFVATDGTQTSCGSPPAQGAWILVQPPSVTRADDCQFVCRGGYVPDGQGTNRACYKNPDTRSISINKGGKIKVIGEKRRTYTKGVGYSAWTVASCVWDYHVEGNTCRSNEKSCTPTSAPVNSGRLTWDPTLNDEQGGWPPSSSHCQSLGCSSAGSQETKNIHHGIQERTCGYDSQWGAWMLETCDAGYDSHGSNSNNVCTLTQGGYYSPNNQKDRTACSALKPNYSHWTTTGLATDDCQWACNSPHYVLDASGRGGKGDCLLAQGRKACSILDMTELFAGLPLTCKKPKNLQNPFHRGDEKYRFNAFNGVCEGYMDASRSVKVGDNLFDTLEACERACPVATDDGNGNSYILAKGVQVYDSIGYYGTCRITACLGGQLVNPLKNECVATCPVGQKANVDSTACLLAPFRLDAPPLINASNAFAYAFSGDCSLESEVKIILFEGVSTKKTTQKVSCVEGQWTTSFDLSVFPMRHIPYKIKYTDRNNRVERWEGKLRAETLLAHRDDVVWDPIYTPATFTWKMAALDLKCSQRFDVFKAFKKFNPRIYLQSISVLDRDSGSLNLFYYRYTKDDDKDGVLDNGENNFISIMDDTQGKVSPFERKSDTISKIEENLKRVIDSKEGVTKKSIQFDFVSSSQNAKDALFTAPKNTGEAWNGRRIMVIAKDLPRECRSTQGRTHGRPWRSFIIPQKSPYNSEQKGESVDIYTYATFSGGETYYQTGTLTLEACFKADGSDSSITIDGVNISLGVSQKKTPTQIARRIANTDFSSGTIYRTHPYTVMSDGNEVTFTLSGSSLKDPPRITISDSTYTEDTTSCP